MVKTKYLNMDRIWSNPNTGWIQVDRAKFEVDRINSISTSERLMISEQGDKKLCYFVDINHKSGTQLFQVETKEDLKFMQAYLLDQLNGK